MANESLFGNCKLCAAKCCRYVAIQIDTPKDEDDYEAIRWYLAHQIHIFVETEDDGSRLWYIDVKQDCKYLKNDVCTIYETRPKICQDYSDQECELTCGDDGVDHFSTMEEFDEFLKQNPPVYEISKENKE